jgi:hypothetical protein
MATSLVPRSRRTLLATSAAVLLALPATGHAAPKAPYPPPNHPSPAAQTVSAGHARTPSDRDPALAQERYYGSYDAPDPASAPVRVVARPDVADAPSGGGVATGAFVAAVAAALGLGLGLGRRLDPLLARLHPGAQRGRVVR